MTTYLARNWLYWNFALSATDEVTNFKEKEISFHFLEYLLTGLSNDTLASTIWLVGRWFRSFSYISNKICLQPSPNLLFLREMFSFLMASLMAAPKSIRYSSSWLLWLMRYSISPLSTGGTTFSPKLWKLFFWGWVRKKWVPGMT